MIRPTPEVAKALSIIARQYPEVKLWLQSWRKHELEQLPSVLQNTALAQGRCQVLSEIHRLLESPETITAKSA